MTILAPAPASTRPRLRLRARARARYGFTLLELLVALAMIAILALSLYSTLRIAFRARDRAEAAVAPVRAAGLAVEFLRNDIESAVPPNTGSTSTVRGGIVGGAASGAANGVLAGSFIGTPNQSGQGEADMLDFYTTADSPDHPNGANGEIKLVELTVDTPKRGGERALLRRVARNLLSPDALEPDEEVLCRNVVGFTLRYYDGQEWQDTWDSTQQNNVLPTAVQVILEIQPPPTTDSADNAPLSQPKPLRFTRIFQLSCAAAQDDTTGAAGGTTGGISTGGRTR